MTKAEFLEMMEQKLTGELDEHTVGKTLRYYSEYIDSEMRKGKTEQEVLEDLGSPLLIARTILDTQGNETANFSQTRPEGETKEEEKDKVREILEEEMKGAAKLAVELEIDLHTGYDWYEAK